MHGVATLDRTTEHQVLDADVGKGAPHHDVVITAARAVGVEVVLLDLAFHQDSDPPAHRA